MAKKKRRPSIPVKIRSQVLGEYRHKCAVCANDKPQLHHIDEDPSNNDPMNLLPLCPNCHLQDIHDPTRPPDKDKLRLFRRKRDPFILDHRFKPLWDRIAVLYVPAEGMSEKDYQFAAHDLVNFIAALNMGEYYSKRIMHVLEEPISYYPSKKLENKSGLTEGEVRASESHRLAAEKVMIELVEDFAVELLRFQNWKLTKNSHEPT